MTVVSEDVLVGGRPGECLVVFSTSLPPRPVATGGEQLLGR